MKRQHYWIPSFTARLLACLAVAAPASFAGGSGSGAGSPGPSAPGATGGDDVETVPILRGENQSGFVLEGSWKDVISVLSETSGRGTVRVFHKADGKVQVFYRGRFEVHLQRELLGQGSVRLTPLGRGLSVRYRDGSLIVRS